MSCGCRSKQKIKGDNTTFPYDDCIECTKKHVLTAFSTFSNFGLEKGNRQIIIGELVLACYHTVYERKNIFEMIKKVRKKVSNREDFGDSLLDLTNSFEDDSLIKEYNSESCNFPYVCDEDENVLVKSEICYSAAMQLAREIGYLGPNSFTIMGNLNIAASKLRIYDLKLSNDLRSYRLLFQTAYKSKDKKIDEIDWDSISIRVNEIVEKEDPDKLKKMVII